MSKIGFIGMGKLGYPCAVAIATRGHDVMGFDLDPGNMSYEPRQYQEKWWPGDSDFNEMFNKAEFVIENTGQLWLYLKNHFKFGSLREVVEHADILFVAVQTPHDPMYEGITPIPDERKDFDYHFLKQAIIDIGRVIHKPTAVVIISTVLPGTIRREILPLCSEYM